MQNDLECQKFLGKKVIWELVVGMEIHAQVLSNSKLFSGASTNFGEEPNRNVSLIDAAMPGMLPVVNEYCIEQTIRTGLGLNAKINKFSKFDRKNYFYPDLPQGYQISQLYYPLVGEGKIKIELEQDRVREIRIERIHLEQDAGKSIHDLHPEYSFVDLNRTGVGLMEIVSRPDIRSSVEAGEYVKKLRQILKFLGTCDGNMQEGSLRADVNVSVCASGNYEKYLKNNDLNFLGTRCEIKNMNSIKFIQQAINFEAKRQVKILEKGEKVTQETRLYDPEKNETRSMRNKEEAHDYRYFPCPDLLPLEIKNEQIEKIKKNLPELPDKKKERFISDYGITNYDANILTSELKYADYFESLANKNNGKIVANWVINELFGRLNKENIDLLSSPITKVQFKDLLDLISSKKISGKIAKKIFDIIWVKGGSPSQIVEEEGLIQVIDQKKIESLINKIINDNPEQVSKAKVNPKIVGWFVGQVMKATKGTANPEIVNKILKERIKID